MKEKLRHFGLETKEIEIFLNCLNNYNNTPTTITQGTNIKRSTVYFYLHRLEEKGLIHYEIIGKKKYINTPQAKKCIQILINQKQAVLNKTINEAPDIINFLEKEETHKQTESEIVQYKGPRQIENILQELLRKKENIHWIGNISSLFTFISSKDFYKHFTLERLKQDTTTYAITDKSILQQKQFSEIIGNFRQFRFISEEIKIPALLAISGNKIYLFSAEKPNPNIICIQNKNIKDLVLLLFSSAWENITDQNIS